MWRRKSVDLKFYKCCTIAGTDEKIYNLTAVVAHQHPAQTASLCGILGRFWVHIFGPHAQLG
jgi:hypothetical protein